MQKEDILEVNGGATNVVEEITVVGEQSENMVGGNIPAEQGRDIIGGNVAAEAIVDVGGENIQVLNFVLVIV